MTHLCPLQTAPKNTSLELPETNVHEPPLQTTGYARLYHRGKEESRAKVHQSLSSGICSPRVLERFEKCGQGAIVYQLAGSPHVVRVHSDKCRHRFCPACAAGKGAVVRSNLEALASRAKHRLKLLTFTLAHKARPLRPNLDRLTAAFRELRRLAFWKRNVHAAAWIIEVKVGKDRLWHPHLHVLVDAPFIEQRVLSAAWLACTGDSYIVDIRAMSASAASAYVAKYVSKPLDQTILDDPDRLEEYMLAVRGKRTVACLGAWRKTSLSKRPAAHKPPNEVAGNEKELWIYLGSYDEMVRRSVDGDAVATETLDLIVNHRQEFPCLNPLPPPRRNSPSTPASRYAWRI